MNSNPSRMDPTEATEQFERELVELITTSFARGAVIEDTWDVPTPVADAPDWSVTVEKRYSSDGSGYDPRFLEE
ncbi:hypothetical protein EA472_18605 [Natrarchaeobius oligotrophus]|uniref:Uncharacterized protein n=2 Tax=Natrarchaeobius TaxID=2501796 RepID=A0A3N6MTN6_NATCH|nr:hypothetical protein EA472_18605 [Natrarchaeobius chitinivorans]